MAVGPFRALAVVHLQSTWNRLRKQMGTTALWALIIFLLLIFVSSILPMMVGLGAVGYLVKEAADIELVLAVRQVASGKQYVHPALGAALLAPDASPARVGGPGGELSDRELEVLRMIALGLTNAEIGERLYVSVRTIETHRSHIHEKLNVRNRAELVRRARAAGLLEDSQGNT